MSSIGMHYRSKEYKAGGDETGIKGDHGPEGAVAL
jgi:hypothetical protein